MRKPKTRYYKTNQRALNRLAEIVESPANLHLFDRDSAIERYLSVLPAQHPKTGAFCYVVALMENGKVRAYCA